jgi:hypothetical protein
VSPHRRRWDVLARVTFGRVRQLDRVVAESLRRAWAAGAGPGDQRLVLRRRQLRLHGYAEQGTGFGYTNQRGYHPILAIRAGTGEVLHVRLRTGSANTLRGIGRFCDELIARVDRAGASGPKLLRANPGFWNKQTFTKLDQAGWQFSIGVRLQPHGRAAIEQTRPSSRASRSAFRVGYGATCRPRSSSSGCR